MKKILLLVAVAMTLQACPKKEEPPVTTEPPVTQPPVTQPPVTQPPVTEPPVTQPPKNVLFTIDPGNALSGPWESVAQLCKVNAEKVNHCLYVNSTKVCDGFGPCQSITSKDFVGPKPVEPPVVTPPVTAPPATPPPTTTPPTPPNPPVVTPPNPGSASCKDFSKVLYVAVPWGEGKSVKTRDVGGFEEKGAVVGTFTVPADFPSVPEVSLMTVAEYDGPPALRVMTISKTQCDFRPVDKTGKNGPIAASGGTTATIFYGIGPLAQSDVKLTPGESYYLNIKNYETGCGKPYCNAIIGINTPHRP